MDIIVAPWCSGCHYCTTSFNKAWARVLCRFKSCSRRVRDSRWWGSLTIVSYGNKAKRLLSVSHTTKTIHHHHLCKTWSVWHSWFGRWQWGSEGYLPPLWCCKVNLYPSCTILLKSTDCQQVLMFWLIVLSAQFLKTFPFSNILYFSVLSKKSKYDIVNVIVGVTNLLPPETVTNTLGQTTDAKKVFTYDKNQY